MGQDLVTLIFANIGIAIAFSIVCFLLTVGVLIIYYKLSKKDTIKNDARLRISIVVIVWAFAVVIRLVMVAIEANGELNIKNFAQAVSTVYFTIAAFGFEGQDLSPDNANCFFTFAAYYAAALWFALTFVAFLTIGVSHQLYSRLVLVKNWVKSSKCDNIYIFTYVTEDALSLADSIVEEHRGQDPLIIFASDEIGKFDRENELHNKIKSRKFLYVNIAKRNDSNHTPLVNSLGLKRCLKNGKTIHVFAFKHDDNYKPLQSDNSDILLDDITSSINDEKIRRILIGEPGTKSLINSSGRFVYYSLTNTGLEYEFYDIKMKEIINEYIKSHKLEEYAETITLQIKLKFKISIVSEAFMVGEDLLEKRHKYSKEIVGERINEVPGKDGHNALILGFGLTGQSALSNLYIDSTGIDKDGNPIGFTADVFDEKISNVAGLFAKEHPSYIVDLYKGNPLLSTSEKDEALYIKNSNLKSVMISYGFLKNVDCSLKEYKEAEAIFYEYNKYLQLPKVILHDMNCNSINVLNNLDSTIGINDALITRKWQDLDYIVVSLGNDEDNIRTANSILRDIRQELYTFGSDSIYKNRIEIFVNIRDVNNNKRLMWNENVDTLANPNIKVSIFGNSDSIYTYKKIINKDNEKNIDAYYKLTGDSAYLIDEKKVKEEITNGTIVGTIKVGIEYYRLLAIYECFRINNEELNKAKPGLKTIDDLVRLVNNYEEQHKADIKKIYCSYANIKDQKKIDDLKIEVIRKCFEDKLANMVTDSEISSYKAICSRYAVNYSEAYFANYVERLLSKGKPSTEELDKALDYLAELEHIRWMRVCFALGSRYGKPNKVDGKVQQLFEDEIYKSYLVGNNFGDYKKEFILINKNLCPYEHDGYQKSWPRYGGPKTCDIVNAYVYPLMSKDKSRVSEIVAEEEKKNSYETKEVNKGKSKNQ